MYVPQVPDGDKSIYRTLQDESPDDILWETVVDHAELERHILDYNQESFRAATESPCGHGVIHDALTFTSLSPEAEELLCGTVPSHCYGNDEMLKQFLASFAIPPQVQSNGEIPTTVSEDEVQRGFNTWKETTSTSITTREILHVINILHVIIFFELRTPDIAVCTCTIIYYIVSFKLCIHKLYHMYHIIVRVQKLLRAQ